MTTNYGVPTSVDWINGYNYAVQQVNKMKCQDPDIIAAICSSTGPAYNSAGSSGATGPFGAPGGYAGGGTCITWVQNEQAKTFPTPSNYYVNLCSTDADCEMGVCMQGVCGCKTDGDCKQGMNCIQNPDSPQNLICGFAPKDIAAGHCVFTTQQACEVQGTLPYTCNDSGCQQKDNLNYSYTEWRPNETQGGTGSQGNDVPSGSQGSDVPSGSHGSDSLSLPGKCVLGNFLLREWCENPSSRCTKDSSGNYPQECAGSSSAPGVTDVPPFFYDKLKGQCYMTHDYCDAYGLEYNKPSCTTAADCRSNGDVCLPAKEGSYCVGADSQCSTPTGDKVGEFFLGNTIFYAFKKKFKCETYEPPMVVNRKAQENLPSANSNRKAQEPPSANPLNFSELRNDIIEKLKTMPSTACVMADKKHMEKYAILQNNYAGPGIHLYIITFKGTQAKPAPPPILGFLADDVEKVYPKLVENHAHGKIICIDKSEIGNDKNLRRLFNTINSAGWMTEFFGTVLTIARKK